MQGSDGRTANPHDAQVSKKNRGWPEYFLWMVSVAQRLVGRNDAEDVANAALFDAYLPGRPKPSFDKEDEVKKYLATLLWWHARALWKRQKRRHELIDWLDIETNSAEVHDPKQSDVMLDRLVLQQALAKLDPNDRQIVVDYYIGGFTADELSQKYGLPESTLRSRIDRATKGLSEVLTNPRGKTNKMFGLFFPLDALDVGLAKLKQYVISWIGLPTFTKVLVVASTCAVSVIPLTRSSAFEGGVNAHPEDELLPTANAVNATFLAPHHSWVETTSIEAIPDVHDDSKDPRDALALHGPRTPVLKTPAPTPEPVSPRAAPPPAVPHAPSCSNALSLAFVAADGGDTERCLNILAENATSPNKCSDAQLSSARAHCHP